MELVYKNGVLKGDIEKGDVRGFYFATDVNGNSTLIKGKVAAIQFLKQL